MTSQPTTTTDANDSSESIVARGATELLLCAQACSSCADACLQEASADALRQCIRLNLDCADVCIAASALAARTQGLNDVVLVQTLEVCATAAQRCAEECERHAKQYQHCARCAVECRRCEEVCRLTMQVIGGASGLVQTN
jgi:hypothetical protein